MAAKTSEWRPGPTVCRCCLAEGCYKDISTEYFWMGKREVYAEMLSDTLNVSIAYSQSGGPNSNSRLICEPCISRLRDASDFRRQVLECEKTFMNHLDPGSSSVQKEVQLSLEEVKIERVKQEKKGVSDDEDFDDRVDFIVDNDDDDDDLDDEPLMKLATKVPKKEVDLLDLLDSTQITVKRKSTAKTKAPPAKKAKSLPTVKPSASKPSASAPKAEKKKKDQARILARRNAEVIVKMSTVYPFRLQGKKIICVYCCEEFEDPGEFRSHVDQKHSKINLFTAFAHIGRHKDYLKVDISDLRCRICSMACETIQKIAQHLKDSHSKETNNLNLKYEVALHPYKLIKDKWICLICNLKVPSLTKLGRHMSTHYSEFICDTCGKCYLTIDSLKYHIRFSHSGKNVCRKCWKDFPTLEEKKNHLKKSIKCRPFACIHCGERFASWEFKQRHLVTMHEAQEQTYPCPECGIVFQTRKLFYHHFTAKHTSDSFLCNCCGRKFTTKNALNDHKLGHSGEKLFQCPVCSRGFTRRRNLKQHLWIHSEIKRFTCLICDKQFNQKVSLKGHMKSHHPNVQSIELIC